MNITQTLESLSILTDSDALFCELRALISKNFTKTPVREIYKAFCYAYKEQTIIVFKANGFLRGQVRLMVANLLKALKQKDGSELIKSSLNGRPAITRIPAPAEGLYLNRVFYKFN